MLFIKTEQKLKLRSFQPQMKTAHGELQHFGKQLLHSGYSHVTQTTLRSEVLHGLETYFS